MNSRPVHTLIQLVVDIGAKVQVKTDCDQLWSEVNKQEVALVF